MAAWQESFRFLLRKASAEKKRKREDSRCDGRGGSRALHLVDGPTAGIISLTNILKCPQIHSAGPRGS